MYKSILIGVSLAVLCGCVSTKNIPITESAISNDTIHSVIVSKREKPSFIAQTSGKALIGGLVGAFAATISGNEIVNKNGIEDRAPYIGNEIFKSLATKYKVEQIKDNILLLDDDSLDGICQLYSVADYVLDVETTNWSFTCFPLDWNNYRVNYHARLRIIDIAKKSILAEGFCSRVPEQDVNSPSYEELMANNAERIKTELKDAADYCIEQFRRETLNVASN